MSEMTGGKAMGGPVGPDAAAGGTPGESDLPRMQRLDESVDDPSDPEAARRDDETDGAGPLAAMTNSGDGKGASDPMPDMSGASGQ